MTKYYNVYLLAWLNYQQQQVYAKANWWHKLGKWLNVYRQESE